MRVFQRFVRLLTAAWVLVMSSGCAQFAALFTGPPVGLQTTEPSPRVAAEVRGVEPSPHSTVSARATEPSPKPPANAETTVAASRSVASVAQTTEPAPNPSAAIQPAEPARHTGPVVLPAQSPRSAGTAAAAVETRDTAAAVRAAAILLAGQQPVTGLPPALAQSPRWAAFAKEVTVNWARYSQKIADPMSQWALAELPVASDTVFYPFSGPDFVTVHQLFPAAQRYVMMAMQNAERPLDLANLAPELIEPSLSVLTSAWQHFGENGFYVTEYLEKYLYSTRAHIGASTFIVSFLTLQGFEIERVVPLQVAADGSLQELAPETPRWRSVRIQASKQGKPIVVDYLKIDLSNPGLQAAPQNLALIGTLTKNPVLFKAASHLPQNVGFNMIANQVLAHSPLIVQDETGLSYSTLIRAHQVALFGKFVTAHHAFPSYHHDLAKAFAQREDIKPLNFRFGYFKDGNYALMVASRK